MKRTGMFLLLFLSICNVYSQEYSVEEIEQNALVFLNECPPIHKANGVVISKRKIQSIAPISRNEHTYFYVVNTIDNAGWAIMVNEKQYDTQMVGFDESGTFLDEDMPPALSMLLQQHMDAIDSIRLNGKGSASIGIAMPMKTIESPIWLGSNMWNQASNNEDKSIAKDCERVYNKFAVKSKLDTNCGKHVVGCGAVAMGQIMRYWKWPDYAIIRDTIISGVWHGGKNIRWYDWENMSDSIKNDSPLAEVDAIAGLLRDCGYAAHSTYHDSGTVAMFKDIQFAMENTFHYHTKREHEYAWTDIAPKIISEIDAQRPVLCQAWKSLVNAHSFVIDGYISSNGLYVHINFGWGGYDNGYYKIDYCLGYDGNRTFLTEIYPDCSARQENVYLATNEVVRADKIFNFYTENDIFVCHNNNSIVVDPGGKMLLRAGNSITLKNGFQARAGSKVEMSIRSSCTDNQPRFAPQRTIRGENDDNVGVVALANNSPELEVNDRVIDHYIVYGIGGQVVMYRPGDNLDISALPAGFYVVQTVWDDGSVASEKIVKQ